MRALLDAIPGGPHSPTRLAAELRMSRVIVSRLVNAVRRRSLVEVMEAMPGPESLRGAVSGAAKLGVDRHIIDEARGAVDDFAALIREGFGTRAALHAAVGGRSHALRPRVDHAGRADAFRGMRQILGVEARTWLTAMWFAPSPRDAETVVVTTLHGTIGLRKLRADMQVYFTFGPPQSGSDHIATARDLSRGEVMLTDLYTHRPAELENEMIAGQLRYRLVTDKIGKREVSDMLAVSHDAKGSRRYGTADAPYRGASVFVDVPSRALICDMIVHRDLFAGASPQLLVYNPGPRGPANPNDRARDFDRVTTTDMPAEIPLSAGCADHLTVSDVPNYTQMVQRVCGKIGADINDFRIYRLRLVYPVISFQYVLAFVAPPPPAQ